MKLKLEIDLESYDNIEDISDRVIEQSANILLDRVMWSRTDCNDDTLQDRVENKTYEILKNVMDNDFKQRVTDKIVEDFARKYDKTKDAKVIKTEYNINSDAQIKESLRDVIEAMVSQELRKRFK